MAIQKTPGATRGGLRVACHAGYRGEETPRRFFLGEREVEVVEVLDRWVAPDHRYFKCRGSDGDIYILRQDVARELWELTMFARGATSDQTHVPQRENHRE
jgi:hypothetical protein